MRHCKNKECGIELSDRNRCGFCRHCQVYLGKKRQIRRNIKEHRCIDCGRKIRPKLIYNIRCGKHLKQNE